jgi:aspartyl protease family protein
MTSIEATVRGPRGARTLEFLVDSGAHYTLVPGDVWRAIGLEPKWTQTFTLADGSHITRSVSECHITMPQGDAHTPVILGENGDAPLLGVITLEILGLVLDPFRRELRRAHMRLATAQR